MPCAGHVPEGKRHPNHPELTRFCDEAHSIIAAGSDTRAVAPLTDIATLSDEEAHEKPVMKLLIVVVSYRVTDLTIECLRALSGQIRRIPGTKVALCENGTGQDAVNQLKHAIEENNWRSWVDLTVIYPNRGFTGGNNAVIRPALTVTGASRVRAALKRRYDRDGARS